MKIYINFPHLQELLHLVIAFFVPIAWTLILYPFYRSRKGSRLLLILSAAVFSALVMVIKELAEHSVKITANQIIADVAGIFFGMAAVSAVFFLRGRRFTQKARILGREMSIQDVLTLAREVETRSEDFYMGASRMIKDASAADLCVLIAGEERKHREIVDTMLSKLLPASQGAEFAKWAAARIAGYGIFVFDFSAESVTPEGLLRYAIAQEKRTQDLYISFKKAFPDFHRVYIKTLIDAESRHIDKIRLLLGGMRYTAGASSAISKKAVIDMLERAKVNEDDFVADFGGKFLEETGSAEELSQDEKDEIGNMLRSMIEDTKRHAETVDSMIDALKKEIGHADKR